MKCFLFVSLLLTLTGPLSCRAKLIIFGDSLSDGGLDGILSGSELVNNQFSTGPVNVGVYPPSPYYQGRFTNGFVWVEVASKILGQEVDNYACGGSNGYAGEITVDAPFAYVTEPTHVPVRSLVQQADAYAALNAGATATGTDTVIVFTGVDEYFQKAALGTGPPSSDVVIAAINETLTIAYSAGARNFVVVDLPPLSDFPFAATAGSNTLSTLTSTHNKDLKSTASTFNSSNPDASVTYYDISSLFAKVLSSPNSFGPTAFTNTTGPCRGGEDLDGAQAAGFALDNCANGDEYVFWDTVHPSKHMHQVIGQDFAAKTGYAASAAVPISTS